MYISAREREIINLLLVHPNGINVQEIAEKLNVSSRTVQRELKGVKSIASAHNLFLKKVLGVGMYLEGTPEQKNELQITILKSGQEFTQKERQELILCSLLKEPESIKLSSLANDLHVTVATVSNDLNKVEEWLKDFDLDLIRKKGYGIALLGSERKKRKALGHLIAQQLNEYEFLSVVEDEYESKNRFTNGLLEIIKLEKLTMIGKMIRDIEQQLPYSLADSAFMTFTIHLSLAIERIIQGEVVKMDQVVLEELSNTKEFNIASQIVNELEEVFKVNIPSAEKGYITMHLLGARQRQEKNDWLKESSTEIVIGSKKLINYVSKELEINFEEDQALFEGLITHIEPAIYRIQKKLDANNPLASQIQEDYPAMFKSIQTGLKEAFPKIVFPTEEIAYLVLHFGSSQVIYDNSKEVRALVLCSSGIGSSKMLASRIKKEIKEITEIEVSSLANLRNIQIELYDIILSTVEMPGFTKKYITVNPLLPKNEAEQIRDEIKRNSLTTEATLLKKLHNKKFQKQIKLETPEIIKQNLEVVHQYSETVLHILNTFETISLPFIPTSSILLLEVCKQANVRGLIGDYFEVTNQLTEREKKGGLGIPGTSIALYHCRSEYVTQPVFLSFLLHDPMVVKAMDHSSIKINTLLLLLAPVEIQTGQLEVLSKISSTIIEDEESTQIFTSNNYTNIYNKLSYALYENLQKRFKN
ncbi:BglG family transcription antiterminator [Gottfriedia acidiceleris]|uniref:BglG family transcription antiterminator n=1 Tax=Gottfriedia acidiceleris TaxID=371036 RepID=A0ABY4JJU7_9BACI|nr:PRD domain-containing protein [Gottfriedia acidiceleris]UPM54118.1 BglG family transcription antiterminator [Gottfriedia acidiceleris]